MVCEILCIGTELLIGDIVNTNATYISKRLSEEGFDVLYHSVCGDNPHRLEKTFENALSRCDLVITTGGLGPTYDDITLNLCAKAFGLECKMDEEILERIKDHFKKMDRVMTKNNEKQAMVPEGARVFQNDFGTAPGICIEKNDKVVVMMPGPPREMKPMLDNEVLPYLVDKYSEKVLVSSNVNIFGMGESAVEEKLNDLMVNSKNPTLAPYVDAGEVRVRVTGSGKNKDEAKKIVASTVQKVKDILSDVVFDVDSSSMEQTLVNILLEKGLTVSTAESCTGGMLSSLITNVSGSSRVFCFGFCTYANEAKVKLLGVNEKTLEKYGAVSEQTACEMAKGALDVSGADIALSLTGIAGPTGGTDKKPVGLVYLGVATNKEVFAKKLLLSRHNVADREYIRTLACKNAMKCAIDIAREM